LATRLRQDIEVEGKKGINFLLDYPQEAYVKVYLLGKKEAINAAHTTCEGLNFWMDGSTLDDGRVWCAVVWRRGKEWDVEWYDLGRKKEVFNTEVYASDRSLWLAAEMLPRGRDLKVVIMSDSVTAIQQLPNDKPGPGQHMAKSQFNGTTKSWK
jgi:hypothetical protein